MPRAKSKPSARQVGPGDPLGTHRVVRPKGILPQAAAVLDPGLPIRPSEILIEVDTLNIDAASFHQLREAHSTDARILAAVRAIVAERGKMHNPVTGSGGMLMGTVREIGAAYGGGLRAKVGDRVATLVSLTLTPLHLDGLTGIVPGTEQVKVHGHAILFTSGIAAKLPAGIEPPVALALLDVCGAPAQTQRLVTNTSTVLIIGGGKAGVLAAAAVRAKAPWARLAVADPNPGALAPLGGKKGLGAVTIQADARDAVAFRDAVLGAAPAFADGFGLVVNTAPVPGTEMAALLTVREGGTILFFGMATSFAAAVLGAEGIGRDARLLMGNGYAKGHAALAFALYRKNPVVRAFFDGRFGRR